MHISFERPVVFQIGRPHIVTGAAKSSHLHCLPQEQTSRSSTIHGKRHWRMYLLGEMGNDVQKSPRHPIASEGLCTSWLTNERLLPTTVSIFASLCVFTALRRSARPWPIPALSAIFNLTLATSVLNVGFWGDVMSNIECPGCQTELSNWHVTCPLCRTNLPTDSRNLVSAAYLAAGLTAILLAFVFLTRRLT